MLAAYETARLTINPLDSGFEVEEKGVSTLTAYTLSELASDNLPRPLLGKDSAVIRPPPAPPRKLDRLVRFSGQLARSRKH